MENLIDYSGQSSPRFINLSGKKFGKWLVLKRGPLIKKATTFWCQCECGEVKQVYSSHLTRGYSKSCLKCSSQKLTNNKVSCVGEIPESFWKEFIRHASGEKSRESRRKLKFNITLEDAWTLYQKQNGKCALSDIPIGFCVECSLDKDGYKKHWKHTASLDRIDSSKNYDIENVQWVHKDINRMKNIYDQTYFIKICTLIAERNKNAIR
jgi:hypothetical protein